MRWMLLFILLVTACSSQTPAPLPKTSEKLLAAPPPDWVRIYYINNERIRLSDFVPPDQALGDWATRLSFEAHTTQDLAIDPIDLLLAEAEADSAKCDFVQQFNIYSGYENNYETSVRLYLCGENAFTNKGEVKLIKAIRGTDFLYSVRVERKIPPFKVTEEDIDREEIAIWSNYLSRITLCDDSETHPCPSE